ncbi:hypothetical protein ACFZCU_06825 [Streptomyces canus]|uniref:hypothetical protein n=1 Tax=Streptomyces canus TaxID=58343 RepID=UPI0036EE9DEC
MARKTGIKPAIAHEGTDAIRLTHVNGRLRIETAFRRSSRGWKRSDYQLFQDGKRRPTPQSWPDYRALLERLCADADAPATLPALVPIGDPETLPVEIRKELRQCETRLHGRDDISVCVGHDTKGRYVIAITSSKATLHMAFETRYRSGRKAATTASTNSVRVVTTAGKDLTDEVEGKLSTALARLLAGHPGTPAVDARGGRVQGSAGRRTGGPQRHGPSGIAPLNPHRSLPKAPRAPSDRYRPNWGNALHMVPIGAPVLCSRTDGAQLNDEWRGSSRGSLRPLSAARAMAQAAEISAAFAAPP